MLYCCSSPRLLSLSARQQLQIEDDLSLGVMIYSWPGCVVQRWHPDRCSASGSSARVAEAKERFQEIQGAYSGR